MHAFINKGYKCITDDVLSIIIDEEILKYIKIAEFTDSILLQFKQKKSHLRNHQQTNSPFCAVLS